MRWVAEVAEIVDQGYCCLAELELVRWVAEVAKQGHLRPAEVEEVRWIAEVEGVPCEMPPLTIRAASSIDPPCTTFCPGRVRGLARYLGSG